MAHFGMLSYKLDCQIFNNETFWVWFYVTFTKEVYAIAARSYTKMIIKLLLILYTSLLKPFFEHI